MSKEVKPSDWTCLDPWWSAYAQTHPIARSSASARVLDGSRLTDSWAELDLWWQEYTDSSPVVQGATSSRVLVTKQLTDSWDELDPWWVVYTETGHEKAVEIAKLLNLSNDEWRHSNSSFETDPLAVDLTMDRFRRGPLQPRNEVEWSRWLAQLMASSPALVTELFDVNVDQPPVEVIREDQLSKQDGSFRRPDILVFYADHGVSIEVKLDDENYQKTADTARLVEHHYGDREWTQALLLPKRKKERLGSIVSSPVRDRFDGQLQIEWDDPGPISVIFWSDVTAAIRSLLRRGEVVDDHWAANAYLFCAVAEQQIMGFQPQPVMDRLAAPANVVDAVQPIWLTNTLGEQLTYLRERVDP